MKKLIFLFLIFNSILSFGQNDSFKNWEQRILSNVSYKKIGYLIENDSFDVFYDKKYIPKSLIDTLKQWDKKFSLANPKEEFRSTDVILDSKLPTRQIIMILKNNNNIIITYKHGGFVLHNHILWAEMQGTKVIDIWIGSAYSELNTIDKIKKVLSENPKQHIMNMVCF